MYHDVTVPVIGDTHGDVVMEVVLDMKIIVLIIVGGRRSQAMDENSEEDLRWGCSWWYF